MTEPRAKRRLAAILAVDKDSAQRDKSRVEVFSGRSNWQRVRLYRPGADIGISRRKAVI